jgi:hypothetical protein
MRDFPDPLLHNYKPVMRDFADPLLHNCKPVRMLEGISIMAFAFALSRNSDR